MRADLHRLENRVAGAIASLEAQERRSGLGRVRVDAAGLLGTMKQLEAVNLRAIDDFPSVFGLRYAATFAPLDCVEKQVARKVILVEQFARGRFIAGGGNPGAYLFRAVLDGLTTAKTCSDAVKRKLGETTSLAATVVRDLQGVSDTLAGVINAMKAQQRRLGMGHVRVDGAALLRTMRRLAATERRALGHIPGVLGIGYAEAFTPLACVDRQLSLNEDVLMEFADGRLRSGRADPDAYPFTFVLGHLRTARHCEKTLETALGGAANTTGPTVSSASPTPATPTTTPSTAPSSPWRSTVPIYLDPSYSFEERAADLVSRMTLAEKVAQLRTNSAPAIPRLGVQQYTYWSEGQHGVNTLGANTNPGNASGGVHATSFPTNFASTMSWDPNLIYEETSAISDEVRGFLDKSLWNVSQNNLGPSASDYGSLTFWAPTVNMDRDPRWGRTDEAFGEDPYLASRMAGAFVDGYQGETPNGQPETPYLKVAATAKHYALNNVEQNRQAISSHTNDTDLHDYYTAPFRGLIENSHVSGLMTSVNAINGTPAMADTYTDNQVAQRTYGFQGYSTSDCGLPNVYRTSPNGHNWAPPGWTTDGQDADATWTNTASGVKVSGAAGGQAYALRAGTYLNCTGRRGHALQHSGGDQRRDP